MNAVALTEELNRLTAEVARLEHRIAEGEGGIADHILLQATLRTQASTRSALAIVGVGAMIPVKASSLGSAHHEGSRPRNVVQLFSTSTHRMTPPSVNVRDILGVFGG